MNKKVSFNIKKIYNVLNKLIRKMYFVLMILRKINKIKIKLLNFPNKIVSYKYLFKKLIHFMIKNLKKIAKIKKFLL